ncbi:branched-chain amino acid ABC transporter substrate-binding protein [Chelativorans sp. Marseille-P2723]|uniref:branched-chain amino acid ABC transporter substrate-binding protein n=1 Tax=Chelativorans sp. Marseille-P2723 TaxID=2709133 RepID=UPI00156E3574|nr:branched-chain amino acid ABC transporter substrate-binding protein [Chelativorans sp. Marseille-P2723]
MLALASALPAQAQQQTIGVAAPLSGNFRLLGEQWVRGAGAAAQQFAGIELVEADGGCSEEQGAAAAQTLVDSGVSIVIGFLCTPAIAAAMPILADAGIPVVSPVRTSSLTNERSRSGWPVYRLGPRDDDERRAVAEILVRQWRGVFFAIIDDGTIYGRELAETLRREAELAGLRPVFFDTFRPQLENQIGLMGRLRRAGATHVFVGGDRADIAIMARDAASMDYEVTFVGGEALRADDGPEPLPAGVLMVGLPEWQEIARPEVVDRLREAAILPEGYVLPGYAALEVAAQATQKAAAESLAIDDVLSGQSFETAIGTILFDKGGNLDRNFYRLFRYDGEQFVEVE